MPQQKGAKRAVKVANRKRKLAQRAKEANLKRLARKASQPAEESKD